MRGLPTDVVSGFFFLLQSSMCKLPLGRQRRFYKLLTVACASKTGCERTGIIDPERISLGAFQCCVSCLYLCTEEE